MRRSLVAITTAAALFSGAGVASAQIGKPKESSKPQASLKAGSPAPALSVENWVKGEKVDGFEKGKVYVVEFWATWCPPCVESIPHLTKLQKEHKDAIVIGVAASERAGKDGKDERLKKVEKFVKDQGSKMAYRVAFDEDRSMSKAWMEPAGQGGIPCSFIVNHEGKIAWIGHPMEMDGPLAEAMKKAPKKSASAEPAMPGFGPAAAVLAQDAKAPAQVEAGKKDEGKKSEPPAKAEPSLKVGDKAPAIEVGKFVKGEPITSFEKGQVYVVEFWATWCGPCIQAIPHVTKLQKEYKDKGVRMLGVSVWEGDQSKVEPFVQKQGDKMGYTVAMDLVPEGKKGQEGAMSKSWMAAAGRDGIPSTFIVDKEGKIAWMGHPMQMDRPLKEIVAGTFDPKKEAELAKKAAEGRAVLSKFMRSMEKGETAEAYKHADALMSAFNDSAEPLNQIAWTIVDPEANVKDKNLDLAFKAASRACALTNHENAALLDTLAHVHFCKGEIEKAIEIQTKAVDKAEGTMKADLMKALKTFQAAKK